MKENEMKREAQLLGMLTRETRGGPLLVWSRTTSTRCAANRRGLSDIPYRKRYQQHGLVEGQVQGVKTQGRRDELSGECLCHQSRHGTSGKVLLMVLHAKYSFFQYWLFGLVLPASVRKLVESDARYFLWAAAPDLQGDEDGTSAAVAPQIAFLPSGHGSIYWTTR